MSEISVVGLGKMGSALVSALLKSGRSVTVWNRSAGRADALVAEGAVLAPSLKDAIAASEVILVCVKNHETATEMLATEAEGLSGKTVIDLSTGGAEEAEALVEFLTGAGATWQIGMINAYPSGIGKDETSILCAGPEEVWAATEGFIKTMGGASAHVGTTAAAIPALFAAMFTARQGFMFGLIYGGAVCKKAGLPVQAFADQVPVTLGMAGRYGELFGETVPDGKYDDSEATMRVYLNALEDVLSTFEGTSTADAFPRLMRDLTKQAVDQGLGDKELTALVEVLAKA